MDLGTGIVTVAPERNLGGRPARPDPPHKPSVESPHFDARGRLARPQHDGDRTAGGAVVDVDRQKAALVIVGVYVEYGRQAWIAETGTDSSHAASGQQAIQRRAMTYPAGSPARDSA